MRLVTAVICFACVLPWTASSQTLDPFNPSPGGPVVCSAVQLDGRIVIAGNFGTIDGAQRQGMARLDADGGLDPAFYPIVGGWVSTVAIQKDGKILIGGTFSSIGGVLCTNLARLNADGTVDSSFHSAPDKAVYSIEVQQDGGILIAGVFTMISGQSCGRIARLNADGSLDTGFNASADDTVLALSSQPDGKILVAGAFTNLDGSTMPRIGRLNPDGSLDDTFHSDADLDITTIALQPDGRILVGGTFSELAGTPRSRIGRLEADGSVDTTFDPGASNTVSSITLQADGKILVGGTFTGLAGAVRQHLGRLNPDGTLDTSFNPGANGTVHSIVLQPDGHVLVGGLFTELAGGSRSNFGRLSNNDAATQTMTVTSSSVTWMRNGSAPEIGSAGFAVSTDGTNWSDLGIATRIAGGFELTGISIPPNASVRAVGRVSERQLLSSSSWLVEDFAGVPFITSQPEDQEVLPGSNATFAVTAAGSAPLSYQWQKDGVNLSNGPDVTGADAPTLVLNGVTNGSGDGFSVIIGNSYGSVTSRVATLSVLMPVTNDVFAPSAGQVYSTAIQADGKVVIAGNFTTYAQGQTFPSIERVNPDGSLDLAFNPKPTVGVECLLIQPDGKIVAGGSFNPTPTQLPPPQLNIARYNEDGTLDASFGATVSQWIASMVLQPDGKILIAGFLGSVNNQLCRGIARLNADGTLDTNFVADVGGSVGIVYCMALQSNGQIVVGGNFTNLGTMACTNLGRLNPDGSPDETFKVSADNPVQCVAIQADGKILVGGSFQLLKGLSWPYLGRVTAAGVLDTSFNPLVNGVVNSLALQADGKILLGGQFTGIAGVVHYNIARLNRDGTVDNAFSCGANGTVYSVAIQPDGHVLVGGEFANLTSSSGAVSRQGIGRFSNTETPIDEVLPDNSTVRWLRGKTAPELAWVSFDSLTDGTNWSDLGPATRMDGGWELSGLSLSPGSPIRARGLVCGGDNDGSDWVSASFSVAPGAKILIDGSFGPTTNGFGFDTVAPIGQRTVVERSADLTTWMPIFTNVMTSSPSYFIDTTPASGKTRFYRMRLESQ